jgi:hypothetical protein
MTMNLTLHLGHHRTPENTRFWRYGWFPVISKRLRMQTWTRNRPQSPLHASPTAKLPPGTKHGVKHLQTAPPSLLCFESHTRTSFFEEQQKACILRRGLWGWSEDALLWGVQRRPRPERLAKSRPPARASASSIQTDCVTRRIFRCRQGHLISPSIQQSSQLHMTSQEILNRSSTFVRPNNK